MTRTDPDVDALIRFVEGCVEYDRHLAEAAGHTPLGNGRTVGMTWHVQYDHGTGRGAVGGNARYDIQSTPRGTTQLPGEVADFVAANDPASVMRRCDAIDRICGDLRLLSRPGWSGDYGAGRRATLILVLEVIAVTYADRPGFEEAWR